jgi:hypothetical protein
MTISIRRRATFAAALTTISLSAMSAGLAAPASQASAPVQPATAKTGHVSEKKACKKGSHHKRLRGKVRCVKNKKREAPPASTPGPLTPPAMPNDAPQPPPASAPGSPTPPTTPTGAPPASIPGTPVDFPMILLQDGDGRASAHAAATIDCPITDGPWIIHGDNGRDGYEQGNYAYLGYPYLWTRVWDMGCGGNIRLRLFTFWDGYREQRYSYIWYTTIYGY